MWGLNSRPRDQELPALRTEAAKLPETPTLNCVLFALLCPTYLCPVFQLERPSCAALYFYCP